jgi:ATP-dependent DNA helicase RecQ
MTKDEFRKLQDLQHESAISWNHIKSVQQVVHTYIEKFKPVIPDPVNPFPLPFDLINNSPQFEDVFDAEGIFRLALYWWRD